MIKSKKKAMPIKIVAIILAACIVLGLCPSAVHAVNPVITNLEFKIPSAGANRASVPYVMFDGDGVGRYNVAMVMLKAENSQHDYLEIVGGYAGYEAIENKYAKAMVPNHSIVPSGTIFNEVRVAAVSVDEFYTADFDPVAYMNSLPETYFTEGENKLAINMTTSTVTSTDTKIARRIGWYGEFELSGLPPNSFVSINRVLGVISGINGASDSTGVFEFEDRPVYDIEWLLGLGSYATPPISGTHEARSYIATQGVSTGGIIPYTITTTLYPVGYDMIYDASKQSVVWNNSLANDGTVNKAYGDASFTYSAVNRTSGGGAISYSVPSNNGVATINSMTGAVSITGLGTVTVTATAAAKGSYATTQITYKLVVSKSVGPEAPNGLSSIGVSYEGGSDGRIMGLKPSMLYEYRSSNTSTWTEISAGATEIRGLSVGSYEIRIRETDIAMAGTSAAVEVEMLPRHDLAWNSTDLQTNGITMDINSLRETIEAAVHTTGGSNKVVYTSSDNDVATVDSNGKITVTGVGITVITATVESVAEKYSTTSITYTLKIIAGDINSDDVVNSEDLEEIITPENYNRPADDVDSNSAADINKDGKINFDDLAMARNSRSFDI